MLARLELVLDLADTERFVLQVWSSTFRNTDQTVVVREFLDATDVARTVTDAESLDEEGTCLVSPG